MRLSEEIHPMSDEMAVTLSTWDPAALRALLFVTTERLAEVVGARVTLLALDAARKCIEPQ